MSDTKYYFAVKCDEPHRNWSACTSREEAEATIPAAEEYYGAKCKVVDDDEFIALQKAHYITGKVHQISKEDWWDALEVLPPLNWHTHDSMEVFFNREYTCFTFTTMYAKYNDKYLCKTVDTTDKSTWISKSDFNLD